MSTQQEIPTTNGENGTTNHHWISAAELQALKQKLREAQETLEAIQSGDVDAVVVSGEQGAQIYTLTGAEEPYRIFVEQMQEGAVTLSREGLVLYCNRKFSEFLGLPLEKVISTSVESHLDAEAWNSIKDGLSPDDAPAVKIETVLSGKERSIPVLLTASKLNSATDEAMCLVVTDLSSQKEKQALKVARDIAEAANQSKDSFLAVLSHELRTPLTPALMAASLLERDPKLSDQAKELAVMIRRNVEVETRLIDDLLDLTRITQGKIQLQKEPVDIHKIIRDAAAVCKPDLDDSAQVLSLELNAANSRMIGDPIRLQQILWNLIRNAGKFSGRQKPIHVSTWNDSAGYLKVEVRDEGVGIEPEVLPRLFNPFEQGSEEITRKFGGLGLGLVISKSIAELHAGGRIEASSPGRDQGSRFQLTFEPLEAFHEPPSPHDTPSKANILLVEDNPDSRLAMSMLLNSLGYRVAGAKDFHTAVELLERQEFDLVVSDVGLPDGNGYELMKEVRKRRPIPGIAVSGFGQSEDIQKAMRAGFTAHLVKPVALMALENAVERALKAQD